MTCFLSGEKSEHGQDLRQLDTPGRQPTLRAQTVQRTAHASVRLPAPRRQPGVQHTPTADVVLPHALVNSEKEPCPNDQRLTFRIELQPFGQ